MKEMEKILSEQISFPLVSISCQMEEIERTLEEKCRILKRPNPYRFRTLPIWHGVKEGGEDQLFNPSAICIDLTSQLIYVGEFCYTGRIQVFTNEGNHYATLRNPLMNECTHMKIHKDHIYLTTHSDRPYFLKLNKKGEKVKNLELNIPLHGISIEGLNIYTCVKKSLTLQIFDLNLKPTKKIILRLSRLMKIQLLETSSYTNNKCLFYSATKYSNNYHPDPIQVFRLDGTLIRSLVTGNDIKYAQYFCLDSYENILVSDYRSHCIRVFSPDRILIQKIGRGRGGSRRAILPQRYSSRLQTKNNYSG